MGTAITEIRRIDDRVGAAFILALAAIAAAALMFTYRVEPPPDQARVVADSETHTYASTPCVLSGALEREVVGNRSEMDDSSKPIELLPFANDVPIADVRDGQEWRRDRVCNAALGFDQIVTTWSQLLGYRQRWDDGGQWRW